MKAIDKLLIFPGGGNNIGEKQMREAHLSFRRTVSVANYCRAYFAYAASGTEKTGGAV